MKLPHYALASVVALGLFSGCTEFYGGSGSVAVGDPDGYFALSVYDGPDYDFYRDGHYYYTYRHHDDVWRRAHERERVHLDRTLHDRYVRDWNESRARTAGHHDDHHDDRHDHDHH